MSLFTVALQYGAYDYLLKPFEREQLLNVVSRALEYRRLKLENRAFMDTRKLRELGERDALADKPKEAFYDIPNIDHSEVAREQYEIGHRATAVERRREGH